MNKLIMTVGLPRSGKSTWAKQSGHPVVCPDSIRLALHGQAFYGPAEPMVWAIARLMVRSLFLSGHETVVLDSTNGTRARRDEWKSREWRREFKILDTKIEECRARASEELLAVIDRMAAKWEDVQMEELDA